MTTRRLLLPLLFLLSLLPVLASAAEVQASLNRDRIQLGETVTLNLRVQGGSVGSPDLSALQQDFDVLGSSSNTSFSIVNGRASSQLVYGVALRPRRAGLLTVPALNIAGGRTQPLQLEVTPPDPTAAADGRKDVFMESSIEPGHAYVGQQLVYTLKLYFAVNLSTGALEDPQAAGVDVRRLGDDLNYDSERGGRRYHVIERRYAMIPQHAGEVNVGPVSFQGESMDPGDPDSPFGFTSTVTASAPPASFAVADPPASWGKSAWLPARQLQLSLDGLPADGQARAGQPLNLSMTLQAVGLPYEALPALSLPPLDGATVYPDKPVTATRVDGQWLAGRRQQNFAVVPERAGPLTIPEITLRWWNVQSGRAEVARIPAHTLTVAPAPGMPAAPPAHAPATGDATQQSGGASSPPPATPAAPAWRGIALAGLGLWLLSLLGVACYLLWRRARRRRTGAPPPGPAGYAPAGTPAGETRRPRQAFVAAARGGDAAAQARTLLAWARTERPGLANLGELAAALASPAQQAAIEALQRARYAGQGGGSDGAALAAAFAKGFAWRKEGGAGPDSPLPPLYPFRLR